MILIGYLIVGIVASFIFITFMVPWFVLNAVVAGVICGESKPPSKTKFLKSEMCRNTSSVSQ